MMMVNIYSFFSLYFSHRQDQMSASTRRTKTRTSDNTNTQTKANKNFPTSHKSRQTYTKPKKKYIYDRGYPLFSAAVNKLINKQ